jgi:uncharacterized protein
MTGEANHCWVIHDDAAGNRQQAIALAEALGWAFQEKIVLPGRMTKLFSPRLLPFVKHPMGPEFASTMKKSPRYVIGCGRQAALATRLMKKAGSIAIQILDPRISCKHWDVVISPMHDSLQGSNIINCVGSLHNVNAATLTDWRSRKPALTKLSSPRTAVFIGGPSRMALFNEGLLEVMFSQLEYDLARHGGSLIICGSRRTPKLVAEKIRHRFSGSNFPIWFDDSDGENIYHAALAHSDRIVLTPDSVNMISEACATDRPVFIAQPERATGRMKHFLTPLKANGRIQALSRELTDFSVKPLSTMPDVVAQLQRFLQP